LCLDEVFQYGIQEKVESYCEDVCEDDEPLFFDILFKDKCDHSGEKMCVTCRVLFERRKLDLSIFTFNEQLNDQSFENITQELQIDKSLENLFEDELNYLDESIRNALVSYITPKDW